MKNALLPVLVAGKPALVRRSRRSIPREFIPTISTRIGLPGPGSALMEGPFVGSQCGARPTVPANVKRVLVPFGLVLVFEAVTTVGAFILLLKLVGALSWVKSQHWSHMVGESLATVDTYHIDWRPCPAW